MPPKRKKPPAKSPAAKSEGGLGGRPTVWQSKIVGHDRVDPEQLLAHPLNYRRHPQAQRDALRDAIAEVGFIRSVTVNKRTGNLIDGHERVWQALTSEQPFIDVEYVALSEDEEKKALATMDPISEMAQVDGAVLDQLLRDVNTGSEALSAMLSELAESAGILSGPTEVTEDEVPEAPAKPITKPGDLWLLGEHRLLCGDSTKGEDVARLMVDSEPAMLLSTDPPYGVDFAGQKYNPRAKAWEGIENDKLAGDDLEAFVSGMLAAWLPRVSKQAGFYFWTAAMQEGAAAAAAVRKSGLHIQAQIIWNKNCLVLGQADYHWKHENCWYAFWKGENHRWFGERTQTTVWDLHKVANSDYVHPMQKPVELYAIPMRNHTREGEIVAEPFSGSGSQLIAAEQLNRRCYAMEISPIYCDTTVTRWERLTGRKAVLAK